MSFFGYAHDEAEKMELTDSRHFPSIDPKLSPTHATHAWNSLLTYHIIDSR